MTIIAIFATKHSFSRNCIRFIVINVSDKNKRDKEDRTFVTKPDSSRKQTIYNVTKRSLLHAVYSRSFL